MCIESGAWKSRGRKAGEEGAGSGSSKKAGIIYYELKYFQKQELKMLFDLFDPGMHGHF